MVVDSGLAGIQVGRRRLGSFADLAAKVPSSGTPRSVVGATNDG
jgi:hypothetical protein